MPFRHWRLRPDPRTAHPVASASRRCSRGWVVAIAALPLILVVGSCTSADNGAPQTSEAPATAVAEAGDFVITVSATGKVTPEAEVVVKSKASGEIVAFPFRAGDRVEKGDLVCRLDPSDEERSLERQESELQAAKARLRSTRAGLRLAEAERDQALRDADAAREEAQARLVEAEARLDREEALYRQGVASEEELQAAKTRVAETRAGLARAIVASDRARAREDEVERARQEVLQAASNLRDVEVALEEALERLAETRIQAPLSGFVTETLVEAGQVIASAISNVGGGTEILKIADLSRLYVLLSVDEVDIGKVRIGQRAAIRADAFPEQVFAGKVVQIAPVGIEEQNVVMFEVKVTLTGEGFRMLRPGMTADVEIEVALSSATVWVPRTAVDPETRAVRVLDASGSPVTRQVRTGLQDANRVEILEGISAGETVVLGGATVPSDWRKDANSSRRSATTRFLWRLRKK